eukprot:CAMPEP_0180541052 /NCGR_PEP_ID=MMETSP1036_2-20121128/67737_1 /TAXON_ID=632150 /ORGANISM="Azadinium spinosum, Strain 3D9" /LENGTH=75 /DNA_ID=CAMNT_0022555875 /DNA_START=100 /DNA_END=325 /DNA_ORIENTATION=-
MPPLCVDGRVVVVDALTQGSVEAENLLPPAAGPLLLVHVQQKRSHPSASAVLAMTQSAPEGKKCTISVPMKKPSP